MRTACRSLLRRAANADLLRCLIAGITLACLMTLGACGTAVNSNAVPDYTPSTANNILTQAEVTSIVTAAATSVNIPLVIAVSDRRGQILAVYTKAGAPTTALANYNVSQPAQEVAAALARTAAFFSSDQAPIGSRTVRFLSGIHFPPGVTDAAAAPLYGIENTNRGCGFNTTYLPGQSFVVPTLLSSTTPGLGMLTGKNDLVDSNANAVNPGGVSYFQKQPRRRRDWRGSCFQPG